MKISHLSLLFTLLLILTFTACNSSKSKPKGLDANAHQQATSSTPGFPSVKRPTNNVNCRNCYATFKLARASQKQTNGHSYIECPVCHQNYLKKAK